MKGLEALPPLGADVIVWRGVSRSESSCNLFRMKSCVTFRPAFMQYPILIPIHLIAH
jgi:hypothetical protein